MQPRVELRDYRFLNLQLRWISGSAQSSASEPEVVISRDQADDSQDRITLLDLTVSPSGEESGYEIKLSIVGVFHLETTDEETEEEELVYIATLNGATILYGIVRAEIASLTSNFPGGRLVLPTVYMHEVMKQQAEEASSGSKSQDPSEE